jgi:hypothetical protein
MMRSVIANGTLATVLASLLVPPATAQSANVVYRCPGNVYTSDRELTAAQAEQRGCRVIEGAPITVVQTPKPRAASSSPAASTGATPARPGEQRVDPGTQRERDSDARRILSDELRKEEERLAELKREFNNGEPERRGDERNYQRYIDRVADMKAGILRKEADIAALKRELAKLPP